MSELKEKPYALWFQRCAAGVLLCWLLLHGAWRILDQTPPRGDQTYYINGAVHIQENWHLSWPEFLHELNDVTSTKIRPPGASLLLTPWLSLFHNNLRLAGLGAVLWFAATFLILYLLGKRLFDSTTGLLAGVYTISLPIVYDTYIDPEFYFLTLLPLALLCCAHLWDESRWRFLWWLGMGLTTALALLTKWVFAVYLFGPMIYMAGDLLWRFRADENRAWFKHSLIPFALMVAPVVLVAVFWYWPNRLELASAFQQVSEMRQFTPFKGGREIGVLWHYPADWLTKNKLIPLLFLLPGLLVPFLPGRFLERICPACDSQRYKRGFVFLFSSVLAAWVYFCIRYDNIPLKYIFALQPVLALLAAAWIRLIPITIIHRFFSCFLLAYGFICVFWLHFAPLPWIGPSALPRSVTIDKTNFFLWRMLPIPRPPQMEEWPQDRLAQAIRESEQETNASPDSGDIIKPVIVLPDLYFFDWRSCGVSMNLDGQDFETSTLHNINGLVRLASARYIVTSRGQVTRFAYRDRDAMTQNALSLNRLIDRAPQWFWRNFRLIEQPAMPYGLPELQLYQRVHPADDAEAEGWCGFWISNHQGDPDAWDQAARIWAMRLNQDRLNRAERIRDALTGKPEDRKKLIADLSGLTDLQPYEMLELGEETLKQCADTDSLCAWKAAWMLGNICLKRKDYVLAQEFLLKAWRLQRERPEIVQSLIQAARATNNTEQIKLYGQILNITTGLLGNNRRPIVYQNAANLLSKTGWNSDALWYGFQGFVAGFNRYPNTKPLHLALQQTKFSFPDYETLALPIGDGNPIDELFQPDAITLQEGQSYVFPFLNLDGGVYRLKWNHRMHTPSVRLAFGLDEKRLEPKTYYAADQPLAGEYVFSSPLWGDRLRIDCLEGGIRFENIQLERIETELSFLDFEGGLNVQGKNFRSEQYDPAQGFSFTATENWTRLNFTMHSDPRAWDFMRIESTGLVTGSAIFTVIVRGDGTTTETVEFTHPLQNEPGKEYAIVKLPEELKAYPFMLGLRIQFDGVKPGERYSVKRIWFVRE